MSGDITFKQLLALDLPGVLPSLVPELAVQLGVPAGCALLSTEALPLATDERSRLMDAAICYRWSSGQTAIIVQVEHWSRTRDLDLRRAARYTTDLLLRHRSAVVLPVMVLCDRPETPPEDRLVITAGPLQTLDFRVVIVDVQRVVLLRWHQHPTRMLAVLAALVADLPPEERALRALRLSLHFGLEFAALALPLIEDLATIARSEALRSRFHHRIRQDRTMASVIDLFRAEFSAEGRAEGRAEGTIAVIRGLVADGILSVDQAHERIAKLEAEGLLTHDQAAAAIARLG